MQHHINKRYTLASYLNYGYYGAFVIILVSTFNLIYVNDKLFIQLILVAAAGICAALAYGCYRLLMTTNALNMRAKNIASLASQNGWKLLPGESPPGVVNSSLHVIAERDRQYSNYIDGPDWDYADLSYAIYQETKNDEYKAVEVYYGVMCTSLPRELPNIIFDSLKQRGRQFKRVFEADQLHRLEGGFDKYFATYFAKDYTIDNLSFITPDVMLALIDASAYDIEIIDNQVLIYGPMFAAEKQIPEMAEYLGAIKKQLLDNILTYRDERLPYHQGRQTVTAQGARLKQRKKQIWISIALASAYIIFQFIRENQ